MSYGPPAWIQRCECGHVRGDHHDGSFPNPGTGCNACGPDCTEFTEPEPDLCGLCGVREPRPGFTACRQCAG